MSDKVTRYSITVPEALMDAFDDRIAARRLANRSEAIRELIRDALVDEHAQRDDALVVGTLTVVYDHHRRELSQQLTSLQHDGDELVICTTHVHLDHHHCLEVIVLRGIASRVRAMADNIISVRGVIHGKLVVTAVTETGDA